MRTLPLRCRWTDVGGWASLAIELGVARNRSVAIEGDALCIDAGNLIWPRDRTIVLFGVEGLAVIDAGDAARRAARSQRRAASSPRARGSRGSALRAGEQRPAATRLNTVSAGASRLSGGATAGIKSPARSAER
jgi:hypothetical protein